MLQSSPSIAAALIVLCSLLPAQDHGPELIFGSSVALTGPAADLGTNMVRGLQAAFSECNRNGGIGGRELILRALDDGYEPARTSPHMRGFARDPQVLGVVGNVGTPTAVAALPIARQYGLPFIGACTGAGILRRQPPEPEVFNYRASYAQETAEIISALVEQGGIALDEIALFTQRDGYGDAGFAGAIEAMKSLGEIEEWRVPHGRYERNTTAVHGALAEILSAEVRPRAVVMVGAYAACASFVKLCRSLDFNPVFVSVSFVGSESLARALGDDGDGIIVTQVVPHPKGDDDLARQYRRALAQLGSAAEPSFNSFEGYIVGRILILALKRLEGPIDRADVIAGLEALGRFELSGTLELELDHERRQASNR
ncbi:MAG: ABC transporter substrate-binding protein, partial [Planctomycetes bacterium]|nr:ABC transporter substrate-binding protein [Planctomycetota bacterium]